MFPATPKEGDRLRYRGGRWQLEPAAEWDDWVWIGQGVNPPGAVAPSVLTEVAAGEWWWVFADKTVKVFPNNQLSHRYQEGTDVRPHIHWFPTTTATYTGLWTAEFTSYLSTAPGTRPEAKITATAAFDAAMTAGDLVDHDFSALLPGLGRKVSSLMTATLTLTLTAGTGCALGGFDGHFLADSRGSRREKAKN